MIIDPNDNQTHHVVIDGKVLEAVNKFKYLGSLATMDSNSTTKKICIRETDRLSTSDRDMDSQIRQQGLKETRTCMNTDMVYCTIWIGELGSEEEQ